MIVETDGDYIYFFNTSNGKTMLYRASTITRNNDGELKAITEAVMFGV